jgi:uncharacterized membrane protein YfcA
MDVAHIVLSLVFGALIGLITGLLGGGGAVLAVLVLLYVFGENLSTVVSTSLAVVGATALVGVFLHSRSGNVRFRTGLIVGLFSIGGAVAGTWLHHIVADKIVLLLFGVLIILVGLDMLRQGPSRERAASGRVSRRKFWVLLAGLGSVVGLMAGFFGVSGGFLVVPALVLVAGMHPHHAVGTSVLVSVLSSVSGFLAHLHFGTVDFKLAGLFVAGALAGVFSGTALCGRLPERTLVKMLGAFIAIVGIYTIVRNA